MSLPRSLLVLVWVLAPTAAAAQAPFEVAGGYHFVQSRAENYPVGWFGNVTAALAPVVALTAQIDASSRSDILFRQRFTRGASGGTLALGYTVAVSRKVYGFLVGPRVHAASRARVLPHAFARAGLVRTSASAVVGPRTDSFADSLTDEFSGTSNRLALDVGGGLKIALGGHVAAYLNASYRRIGLDDESWEKPSETHVFIGVGWQSRKP